MTTMTTMTSNSDAIEVVQSVFVPPIKPDGYKRLIEISDIHLGHRNTPSWLIVENLRKYILNPDVLIDVDGIIIAGDLNDRIMTMSSTGINAVTAFYNELLHMCKTYNVALRVLEGTPLHDRGQSERLLDLNHVIKADVRYYSEMDIVYDEVLDLTIGYVPDECRETYEQAESDMEELMTTRGYTSVHMFVMHGLFSFQLPIVKDAYNEKKWLRWVKHHIVIGHDHNPKQYGKIYIPGPFDGLKHGEGAKGFMIVDYKGDDWRVHRISNETAMKYISLSCVGKSDYDSIKIIGDKLRELGFERPAALKLVLNDDHMLMEYISEWKQKYRNINLTVEKVSTAEKSEDTDVADDTFTDVDIINIHDGNVEGMILRELGDDCAVSHAALIAEISSIRTGTTVRS